MAQKKEVETVRLRNVNSGAIVTIAAEKLGRMGSEWELAESKKSTKSSAAKSDSSD